MRSGQVVEFTRAPKIKETERTMSPPLIAHDKVTREISKGIYHFGIPEVSNQETAPAATAPIAQEFAQ